MISAAAAVADTRTRDRIILTIGATTLGAALLAYGSYCIACLHPAVVYAG